MAITLVEQTYEESSPAQMCGIVYARRQSVDLPPSSKLNDAIHAYLDHDWISGLGVRRIIVHAEAETTPSDTEALPRHVEILSEQMQEV